MEGHFVPLINNYRTKIMSTINKKYIHIWISLILFMVCLALPGFYIREAHEPQLSFYLLIMGWLGPLDGHFSWFANIYFLIALLKYKKPKTSSSLGFIALALALSFLGYEKIIVSEAPTYARITAYGFGYMLWFLSIGILSIGQFSLATNKSKKVTASLLSGWVILVLSLFSFHYFVGDNSQYSIEVGRDSVFEEKCRISGQTIYEKSNDAKGIFFDRDWGDRFAKLAGYWWHNGGEVLGHGKVNEGLLLFYEKKNVQGRNSNLDNSLKYRRYELGDHKGIEVNHLSSEYAVITQPFDIPKKYGIDGAEIIIKDLRNEKILATTSYVFDPIDRRFCGHAPNGRFFISDFVIDVLNLTKKYPSGL